MLTLHSVQNWRRNVKARLFVMTLRDYFQEKVAEHNSGVEILEDWALKYTDSTWLQPIMEAFDDDASGYITILELNHFTDAKPESLNWRYVGTLLSKRVAVR